MTSVVRAQSPVPPTTSSSWLPAVQQQHSVETRERQGALPPATARSEVPGCRSRDPGAGKLFMSEIPTRVEWDYGGIGAIEGVAWYSGEGRDIWGGMPNSYWVS
jgi:hypothetical protein